ncbi:hypothetical protein [Amycolatopsis sp. cmx-8-4]|uniref:hypothetical protein n=1 Tax=Amycolatopsis sp. cmx-8-4 TaxID=2790947 RepID=UPI00397ABF09
MERAAFGEEAHQQQRRQRRERDSRQQRGFRRDQQAADQVDDHRRRLRDRVHAVVFAYESGLVQPGA